jgi:hypothetical protein
LARTGNGIPLRSHARSRARRKTPCLGSTAGTAQAPTPRAIVDHDYVVTTTRTTAHLRSRPPWLPFSVRTPLSGSQAPIHARRRHNAVRGRLKIELFRVKMFEKLTRDSKRFFRIRVKQFFFLNHSVVASITLQMTLILKERFAIGAAPVLGHFRWQTRCLRKREDDLLLCSFHLCHGL